MEACAMSVCSRVSGDGGACSDTRSLIHSVEMGREVRGDEKEVRLRDRLTSVMAASSADSFHWNMTMCVIPGVASPTLGVER